MRKLIILSLTLMLIIFVALQSGCKKDNNEYADVIATADTIHGTLKYKQTDTAGTKVIGWPFGTATFKVITGISDVLASGVVNADGTFVVVLPGKLSGAYFSSLADEAARQSGTVKAAPETIRFMNAIQFMVDYTDKGNPESLFVNLYTLKSDFTVEKSFFYNFYDLDGTFTGTSYSGNIFNWTFTKGWGMVESYKINPTSDAFNSKSVIQAPAEAAWVNI